MDALEGPLTTAREEERERVFTVPYLCYLSVKPHVMKC